MQKYAERWRRVPVVCCYDGLSVQNHRKVNMDSLFLKERVVQGERIYIAVVCDGVGSMESGAFASSNAIRLLKEWFDRIERVQRIGLELRDQVLEINRYISAQAEIQGIKTASTLSALLLCQDKYYLVHAGDSRIYLCRNGGIIQLTRDQVSEEGRLTASIGRFARTELQYSEGMLKQDVFLLCSDGLYKKMDMLFLHRWLLKAERKNMNKVMNALLAYAVWQGERDNISLALMIRES